LGVFEGPYAGWVRIELELHGTRPDARKGRVVPWDILTSPGKYLAGSAKALGFLSEYQFKVKVVNAKAGASLASSLKHARRMFGNPINACIHMGMSDRQIVMALQGSKFPDYYEPHNHRKIGLTPEQALAMVKEIFGDELEWEKPSSADRP
jgi:DNA relaxase NicK